MRAGQQFGGLCGVTDAANQTRFGHYGPATFLVVASVFKPLKVLRSAEGIAARGGILFGQVSVKSTFAHGPHAGRTIRRSRTRP